MGSDLLHAHDGQMQIPAENLFFVGKASMFIGIAGGDAFALRCCRAGGFEPDLTCAEFARLFCALSICPDSFTPLGPRWRFWYSVHGSIVGK